MVKTVYEYAPQDPPANPMVFFLRILSSKPGFVAAFRQYYRKSVQHCLHLRNRGQLLMDDLRTAIIQRPRCCRGHMLAGFISQGAKKNRLKANCECKTLKIYPTFWKIATVSWWISVFLFSGRPGGAAAH